MLVEVKVSGEEVVVACLNIVLWYSSSRTD
jgi:hypothetical protein